MSDAMTDMRNNKKLRDEIESLRQQYLKLQCDIAALIPPIDGERANDPIIGRVERVCKQLAHHEAQIVMLRDAEHDFRHNKDEWGFISRVTEILSAPDDLNEQGK